MMSSGDRTFDNNHQNSSASFPSAAVSGFGHPGKSVKFAESNFRRLNDPMVIGERNWGFDDTARALGILKEIDSKLPEVSLVSMPNLLSFLKHGSPVIVRQSIATGTRLFCAILAKMALQLRSSSNIEGWLEEMWSWVLQFKDSVRSVLETGSTGSKVLAAKFLEICFLLFTSDGNDSEEVNEWNFNISWFGQSHPTLNPTTLAYEASKILDLFLDILQSACVLSGSLVITVINCLASIAKKRPVHYDSILPVLLEFDPNFRTSTGGHAASIQYAVRIALLGFLRCTHASIYESRDKVLGVIKTKYSGEATDLFIRQADKMSRGIERNFRDIQQIKVDPPASQMFVPSNITRMRHLIDPGDSSIVSDDLPPKRTQFSAADVTTLPVKVACDSQDANDAIDNFSLHTSSVSSDSSPAEKMILAIGALLAEGDKGVESLEILLSQIDADLFADIVIENMKHLPKSPFTSGQNGSMLPHSHTSLPSVPSQTGIASSAASGQPSALPSTLASAVVGSTEALVSDIPSVPNLVTEFKRDPRRDPRRLDPRRAAVPVRGSTIPLNSEGISDVQGLLDSSSKPTPLEAHTVENVPESLMFKTVVEPSESEGLIDLVSGKQTSEESLEIMNDTVEIDPSLEGQMPSDLVLSPVHSVEQEMPTSLGIDDNEDVDGNTVESDHYPSSVSMTVSSEDISHNAYPMPLYVELTNDGKKTHCKLAIIRLIDDYKQIQASGGRSWLPLLAHLVAQIEAGNDLVMFFREHVILDYHHNKGHDLAMHVLYHLYAVEVSDLDGHSPSANNNYEKFLLAIAKTLIDSLPASDKSFSRLLCDAPFLTESAIKLLEDLCQLQGYENTRDGCDGDRITQGLGAIWSLVLGRPLCRQSCLDIALKCSVHSHDEVRAKAIRMVTNKLFLLPYAEENVEKFARSMLLLVADQQASEAEAKHLGSREHMTEETSVSGLHNSELGTSESEPMMDVQLSSQSIPAMSSIHAYRRTSLFFALCAKKPSLVHPVFDVYGQALKVVKQAIHRHVPGLVRILGPSHPELLRIISDPPEGSKNLIMQVLELMTEDSTPSADLIASVKHLYDTKLKDVSILIPLLSSLSKDEVLPIFPRLVELPLDKFQAALARILQGSAHTGPALTPVEVLVAIHDVDFAKHGIPLKKITDACTACFEQRTVFTQQVLAKSLSHMVEQVPLPMLFMRTMIQCIGNFPNLVDFVMEILSKLVSRQIWRMPKLWVGFLKLVSQTHPHSFNVLLQLPPPQLENALNKHANLRGPLAAYANQPNIRTSLSRQTLQVLGLNEPQ